MVLVSKEVITEYVANKVLGDAELGLCEEVADMSKHVSIVSLFSGEGERME
jgi:hypothetical protein